MCIDDFCLGNVKHPLSLNTQTQWPVSVDSGACICSRCVHVAVVVSSDECCQTASTEHHAQLPMAEISPILYNFINRQINVLRHWSDPQKRFVHSCVCVGIYAQSFAWLVCLLNLSDRRYWDLPWNRKYEFPFRVSTRITKCQLSGPWTLCNQFFLTAL